MSSGTPLREQLKSLELLQELDSKILHSENSKNALPSALKEIEQNISQLDLKWKQNQASLEEIRKTLSQNDAARQLNEDRLNRAKQKLEAVSTGGEFQAANKEIEQLKKLNENLEKTKSEQEAKVTTLSEEESNLKSELEKFNQQKSEKLAEITQEQEKYNTDIGAMSRDREQYLVNIDKPLLARYDRVRKARAGVGLAPAINGQCQGCNMSLTPQIRTEILRYKQVVSCPSCQRILYVPGSEGQ